MTWKPVLVQLRVGDKKAEDRYIDKRSDGIEIKGVSSSGSQRYTN